ncbi:MAG TPA: hypothetical protein PKU80_04925 [Candidatus Limiplasma sp.]|nr:hypothetical protein [Candidatus Limiplasma sp.]HRX09237.1 hypothetical protein [Candidatus Limiplasma sp.]
MKHTKRFLAVVCTVVLLLTAAQAVALAVEPAIFLPDDLAACDPHLSMTRDEVSAMFGAPGSAETITSEATGDTYEVWTYEGMTVTFSAMGGVNGVQISGAQYMGPRGIAVGQSAQDVAGLFYTDPDTASDAVFYSAGYVDMLDAQLPPCGYKLDNEDGTFLFNFVAPMSPFEDDVRNDLTNYLYQELALLQVNFSADGLVTGYSWRVGPFAE